MEPLIICLCLLCFTVAFAGAWFLVLANHKENSAKAKLLQINNQVLNAAYMLQQSKQLTAAADLKLKISSERMKVCDIVARLELTDSQEKQIVDYVNLRENKNAEGKAQVAIRLHEQLAEEAEDDRSEMS